MTFANRFLKMDKRLKGTILSGYRVLDLTDEKGMFCARLLADMGAEVIRVENPQKRSAGRDSCYCYLNASKRSISLNIETEIGRAILRRLAKTADVLVESESPGYLEELGLGYSELSEINPGLVVASVTGFGQDGSYRDFKSSDMVVSALGGQMYVCGEPDTPPLKLSGNQAYYSACLFAAIGVMLALRNRHTTGRGQHVDVSAMECAAATLDHVLVHYFYEGVVSQRRGSLHWNNAFRVFPCRDGYILLSLFQQWETLVEWLDAEGMAGDLTDKKWRNREERLAQLDHIIEVLERWTQSHTVAELVEKGQLMHFPWADVASISGLVDSPQLAERDFFVEVECPDSGKSYKCPGVPCKLTGSPWQVGGSVPGVGEHNRDIYRLELGFSAEEIEALTRDGVI
ncbi:CaiB/BaiF CoA transferase family protein [Chloroflexota bacterium]